MCIVDCFVAIVACNLKIGSSQIASIRTKRIPRLLFLFRRRGTRNKTQ
jgi:hypothetical protein